MAKFVIINAVKTKNNGHCPIYEREICSHKESKLQLVG